MVGLHRAHGDERVAALRKGIGDEEFELSGLVAPAGEAGEVVAFDPDVGPAEVFAQAAQRFERRVTGGVAAAGETGEVHLLGFSAGIRPGATTARGGA